MKNNVAVKVSAEGAVVTPYSGNPDFGYVILSSVESVFQNGWLQKKERSCIIKGETAMLESAFSAGQTLPGKIFVTECTEDNIPQTFTVQFNKEASFEENIEPFIKRAGKDGPVLMSGDKRILRFAQYDPTGHVADVRVQHDNGDEVKAYNATQKAKEADLS
jgi:hypothetical protein